MLLITKTDPELNKRKEMSQRYERQGRVIIDHCVILSSCCQTPVLERLRLTNVMCLDYLMSFCMQKKWYPFCFVA